MSQEEDLHLQLRRALEERHRLQAEVETLREVLAHNSIPAPDQSQHVGGRRHRIHHDKRIVRVYDYVDAQVPMLARMYGNGSADTGRLDTCFPGEDTRDVDDFVAAEGPLFQ